jgi:hypothetical protein
MRTRGSIKLGYAGPNDGLIRLCGIPFMVVQQKFFSIPQVSSGFPCVVLRCIAFPLNQEFDFLVASSRI